MFRRSMLGSGLAKPAGGVKTVGVDIDLSDATSDATASVAMADRGWLESSRDLLHGVRVVETPMDTLPKDLIEQFVTATHLRRQR
jgi:hypothetical protein